MCREEDLPAHNVEIALVSQRAAFDAERPHRTSTERCDADSGLLGDGPCRGGEHRASG